MAGPVATLQITCGVLLVLAVVLALVAGDLAVVLTALGVTGLVPVALGSKRETRSSHPFPLVNYARSEGFEPLTF